MVDVPLENPLTELEDNVGGVDAITLPVPEVLVAESAGIRAVAVCVVIV